jgi:hypothetical protein
VIPYRIILLKLVPSPRPRSGAAGTLTTQHPKRDGYQLGRWALSAESKTGKETSLEDNEKEPEPSWDSRGGDVVMTNKTVARGGGGDGQGAD